MLRFVKNPRVILIVTAIIAVGAGVVWYQAKNKTDNTQGSPSVSNNQESSAIVTEGGNAINAENQEGGETILIDLAILDKPGFVVIHKATNDGKPGEVVGHSDVLQKGRNEDVVVDIDPEAVKDDTYLAMLHEDANSDGDFGGTEEDKPIKDTQGNSIMMKLTITSYATPVAEE